MSATAYALISAKGRATPLYLLETGSYARWLNKQEKRQQIWLALNNFKADAGQMLLLPAPDGSLEAVVVGAGEAADMWSLAALPHSLPRGNFALASTHRKETLNDLALGWALGTYKFDRYLSFKNILHSTLHVPGADLMRVERLAGAIKLVRDLINTPANDLGPEELVAAGLAIAKAHKAKARVLKGEELLQENYPAIYAVGKGSARPPMLLDFSWGPANAPKLTLVGKGVVFDTGGLDIKPSAGMLTMKKDMGGAAHVLALAQLIMQNNLKVRLRVLVPAVENSVSGNAMRPSDIIPSRSGKTIEIGNTDAEGRVILCDCLYEAAQDKPDWLIDFATLTGAAWMATGPQMGTFFSNDEKLAAALQAGAARTSDPLHRMPLYQPYVKAVRGKISDLNNNPSLGSGGTITAALFLEQFIGKGQRWAHFDVRAWNEAARPGRPDGGDAWGLRASYDAIERKFKAAK